MTDADSAIPASQTAERKTRLRNRMFKGSILTIAGYGVSRVIRLVSNIVLAGILFPEAFGLMALVNVFLQGLQLFSDVGLPLSIIQNPRGGETKFLRTVWTIGLLRGLILLMVGFALSWPVAAAYDEPDLVPYIQVACLVMILDSLRSTKVQLCSRQLLLGKVVLIEILGRVAGSVGMILLALQFESVWALVAGGLINSAVHMLLSHMVLKGPRMRLHWDRTIVKEVVHFGKWIFVSTALTFGINCLDRVVLGKLMTLSELGVYSIAFGLTAMVGQLLTKLTKSVFMPVYSRLLESDDHLEKRTRLFRIRFFYSCAMLVPVFLLMFLGQFVVDLLYDERYADAGWMLRYLIIGTGFGVVTQTLAPVMLASGNSRRHLVYMASQLTVLVSLMLILGSYFGVIGIIWAAVLTPLVRYPVLLYLLRDEDLSHPKLDIPLLILIGTVGVLALP